MGFRIGKMGKSLGRGALAVSTGGLSEAVKAMHDKNAPGSGFGDEASREFNQRNVVKEAFQAFGYNPSDEEIAALSPTAGGETGGAQRGRQAVSIYVQAAKRQQELNANDPLKQVIADERGFFNSQQTRAMKLEGDANTVYGELHDTFSQAPKLFGSLTPDQIDQYLKPLDSAQAQSSARLEGAAGRRGIVGSSTEMNSLADSERKYKENVLSTGLQVGMTEQDAFRKSLSDRISGLLTGSNQAYGFLPGSLQRQAGIAQVQGANAREDARYLNELPLYLTGFERQAGQLDAAEYANKNQPSGMGRLVGSVAGMIPGIAMGNPMVASVGSQIGGGIGDYAGGGSGVGAASSAMPYLPMFMNGGGGTTPPPSSSMLMGDPNAYNRLNLYNPGAAGSPRVMYAA